MLTELGRWVGRVLAGVWRRVHSGGRAATRPTSLVAGLIEDAFRSREELIADDPGKPPEGGTPFCASSSSSPFAPSFSRSSRRTSHECIDHVMPFGERHLLETLLEYARHFNATRTHQGIGQLIPAGFSTAAVGSGSVIARPVLNGLHHDYRRAA